MTSENSVSTYFNWRTPSSLFPPSAIISLTDDNSTFFLARPAAFGPDLPSGSLSGQLWIGSGFSDDHAGRNGPGGRLEGELGCSDVSGWSETSSLQSASRERKSGNDDGVTKMAIEIDAQGNGQDTTQKSSDDESDGTDNHLSPKSKRNARRQEKTSPSSKSSTHADIQSLQESAEIAGKVALMSRGGCGFLDKVEWAQRRGAVAVIIGDDVRGGPLVTMYARGDTSNISIPALFTSHTTAHLLSSLMPTGGRQRFLAPKAGLGTSYSKIANSGYGKDNSHAKSQSGSSQDVEVATGSGWFWSLFGIGQADRRTTVYGKHTNSGGEDWVEQTDFEDQTVKSQSKAQASNKPTDGFLIGVQDWRDPDLVVKTKSIRFKRSVKDSTGQETESKASDMKKSGSTTAKTGKQSKDKAKAPKSSKSKAATKQKDEGWFNRIVNGKGEGVDSMSTSHIIDSDQPVVNPVHLHDIHIPGARLDESTEHEGLWVTLSATSMSNSPFLDTLLVLVVSPLVTLTVVYALLLLRSRIRRRRWRAPKSVVERLPVRTYQTMPSSISSVSSSVSTASVRTPLLSAVARPIAHRQRSRTGLDAPSASHSNSQSLDPTEEKREAGLAEWRRKYGGKQKECVVCLEEYVDGVSRVMSLPCGHEFHEGCM